MYTVDSETESKVDIMLAVGDTSDVSDDVVPDARHFEEKIALTESVAIGPIESSLREAILDAREARGLNCFAGYRQYGALYGLIRADPPRGAVREACDPDHELSRVAAILRLARPHAMSMGDAARVITQTDGRQEICPSRVEGPGSQAFVITPADRWIRDQDVELATRLLSALGSRKLPSRIRWAMVAHELLHWQFHVEVRWLLLCTALEGLVHTDDRSSGIVMQNREQFVVRLGKLQEFVPDISWTESELDATYDHRNETMHGADIRSLWISEPFPPLYKKAESGLRAIVRGAILKPGVTEIFESDASIRTTLGSRGRTHQ